MIGALHWGMEIAGFGGHKGYQRLALGAAPILLAWPTLGLQPMTALTVQWLGFTGLWYADSKATMAGWGKCLNLGKRCQGIDLLGLFQRLGGILNIGSIFRSLLEPGMLLRIINYSALLTGWILMQCHRFSGWCLVFWSCRRPWLYKS
jgi:hypothetical protein